MTVDHHLSANSCHKHTHPITGRVFRRNPFSVLRNELNKVITQTQHIMGDELIEYELLWLSLLLNVIR